MLPEVEIPEEMLYLIAKIAIEMGVDGHRADLVMMKATRTMASLAGRTEVARNDVHQSVNLALLHRMRRRPFQEMDIDREKLQVIMGGQKSHHFHEHSHGHSRR